MTKVELTAFVIVTLIIAFALGWAANGYFIYQGFFSETVKLTTAMEGKP